ncbi:MAG: autotransporter outer membrane beta-barrel domain-containing protein, partial [Pseudomonadota bacterium]
SVDAPTLLRDRACTAASQTQFRARITVRGDTTDDRPNRDAYAIYLLDGAGRILDSRARRQRVGQSRTRNETLRTRVDPRSGPFRVVVVDAANTMLQGRGQTLGATPIVTRRFDAAALDADCPQIVAAPAGGGSTPELAALLDSQTDALATAGLLQPAALTLGRLRRLSIASPAAVSAGPSAGLFGLQTGAAGQGAPMGVSVWADATWSELQPEAAGGGDVDAVTAAVGADAQVSDSLTLGLALFGGVSVSESAEVKTTERSVGFAPYASLELGDGFSLQASAGYSRATGETERAGASGDYTAHRGYGSLEASHYVEFGEASLLSTIGALYGRSTRGGFTDSGGLSYGGDRTNTGAAHALVQPGYRLALTDAAAITPYLHAEYRREFAAEAGTQPNSARLGGGARVEAGDGLSGRLEAIRGVGAGGDEETSLRVYFAYDF